MRRFMIALVAATTLALGGCGLLGDDTKSVLAGGGSITATITNPVSKEVWYGIEGTYLAAVTIMVQARRNMCTDTRTTTCVPVDAVRAMRDANRKARTVLLPFRSFMRNNDQISAVSALASVRQAVTDFSALASAWK